MRNWRYALLILSLTAALGGCAVAPEKPAAVVQAPALPEYTPPPANLTTNKNMLKPCWLKTVMTAKAPTPTVIVVTSLAASSLFTRGLPLLKPILLF